MGEPTPWPTAQNSKTRTTTAASASLTRLSTSISLTDGIEHFNVVVAEDAPPAGDGPGLGFAATVAFQPDGWGLDPGSSDAGIEIDASLIARSLARILSTVVCISRQSSC